MIMLWHSEREKKRQILSSSQEQQKKEKSGTCIDIKVNK